VESLSYEDVIPKYDSSDSFFYIDPPYWNTEHYYTKGEFNEQDHLKLSQILNDIDGKFALSYYYFEELEEWYPRDQFRWEFKDFMSSMSAGANLARAQVGHGNKVDVANHTSTELLIMNY
jgi:DNA adenine methylase